MPKARRLGNYMKADDIGGRGGSAILRIEEAGDRNFTEYRKDGVLELPVTPVTPPKWTTGGNDPKTWSLNRTSEDTLLNYLGEDSEDWINKLTRVNVLQQNVRGTMKSVLYAEALTPEEQPQEKAKQKTLPPTEGKTPTLTEETQQYLKNSETKFNEAINNATWNNIPNTIKQELANHNWIIYKNGYPTISPNAKHALDQQT